MRPRSFGCAAEAIRILALSIGWTPLPLQDRSGWLLGWWLASKDHTFVKAASEALLPVSKIEQWIAFSILAALAKPLERLVVLRFSPK